MKSTGVFVGGLTSVLSMNLMLIGVCSSAPVHTPPAAVPPPPAPAPIVRMESVRIDPQSEPLPWGSFIWRCNGHISIDADEAVALPICLSRGR